MEPVKFRGVTVDRCTRCQGIFCDAGEQFTLKNIRGAAALDTGSAGVGRDMDEKPHANCPRCAKPMRRVVDAENHINFEVCDACRGIYFDAGEFREFKHSATPEYFRALFGDEPK
jgi:Zn-finger nucleic acid-binding protein